MTLRSAAVRAGLCALLILTATPDAGRAEEPAPPEPANEAPSTTPAEPTEPPPTTAQIVPVGPSPRLLIDAQGRIRIRRGSDSDIRAEFISEAAGANRAAIPPSFGFRLEPDVGGVRLKAVMPANGTLAVSVPAAATIHVAHLDGSLVATDLSGDFSARSRTGDFELESHGGGVEIELQKGSVKLSRFRAEGKAVNIDIGEGSAAIDLLAQTPGAARVVIERGRIELVVSPETRANVRATDLGRVGLYGERARLERFDRVPREVIYTLRGGGALWDLTVRGSGSRAVVIGPEGVRPDSIDGLKPQP